VFGLVPDLEANWDAAVVERLEWLRRARNRHAFHYMTAAQWTPDITDDLCDGASAIVGRAYGDTGFVWSDALASLPLFKLVNELDPFEGFGTILSEVGQLLGSLLDCLAQGLQAYMKERLTTGDALGNAGSIEAPSFDDFRLPYFFAPPPRD